MNAFIQVIKKDVGGLLDLLEDLLALLWGGVRKEACGAVGIM